MDLIQWLTAILNFIRVGVFPLVASIAFLFFLINAVRYFMVQGGSEDGREKAKRLAIWGLLALFIIFSIWGIVELLIITFGFNPNAVVRPDYLQLKQ